VAERYQVIEVLETGPGLGRYRALDRALCAYCGYEGNSPNEPYCYKCGAGLDQPPTVELIEQQAPKRYDARFSANDREYYVLFDQPEGKTTDSPPARPAVLRLCWAQATDPGAAREHNEDYVDARLLEQSRGATLGLFLVADGLGGQDSGEVASKLAAETLWLALKQAVWEPMLQSDPLEPEAIAAALSAACNQANQVVFEERAARHSSMSTTLTALLIVGNTASIANIGDSRTYLWNTEGLTRLTRDHSFVQRLVDAGELQPSEVYTHPQRNLIYMSIGDQNQIRADVQQRQLAADDRFVLCSDGLWEMIRDEGIEEVLLAESDPQRACDRLVANANLAGGEDNISVVIVHASAEASSPQSGR
jgi:protein phosphatase